MPQTTTQRNAARGKATTTRKPRATRSKEPAQSKREPAQSKREPAQSKPVERTAELSDEVLKSLESGQRAAIDAVRKFVDTVDKALPALGERPSRRQEVVDAAMEMADRLVHTQYDFLRNVVQSASKALSRSDDGK